MIWNPRRHERLPRALPRNQPKMAALNRNHLGALQFPLVPRSGFFTLAPKNNWVLKKKQGVGLARCMATCLPALQVATKKRAGNFRTLVLVEGTWETAP